MTADTQTVTKNDRDLKTPVMVVIVLLVLALPGGIAMMSTQSGANFADAEQFTGNRLGAGSVDIGLGIGSGGSTGGADGTVQSLNDPEAVANQQSSSDPQLFSATNLAPGDVATGSLAVNNTGSLPLHFWVVAAAVSSSATLDDWLLFDGWRSANCATPPTNPNLIDRTNVVLSPTFVPMIGQAPQPGQPIPTDGTVLTLQPGESVNVCLAARLPLAAPNEVQSSVVDVELIVNAQQAITSDTEENDQ